jgi:hypothetical protein
MRYSKTFKLKGEVKMEKMMNSGSLFVQFSRRLMPACPGAGWSSSGHGKLSCSNVLAIIAAAVVIVVVAILLPACMDEDVFPYYCAPVTNSLSLTG